MKIKIDKILIITTIVCLLPMILSLAVYNQLPDKVAVHWDFAGNPNNYASKAFAAIIFRNANKIIQWELNCRGH